jgi:predicted branched-subunit amino acid permease
MRSSSPRAEFAAGVKAEVPLLFGVLPFGLIYGALALQAGIPPMAALAMSSIVLAGSAQFVGTQLFAAGAPGALIILTTLVVNLRHMLYSASVAPYLSRLRLRWKLLLAYLLTDEAYAMAITHYQQTETGKRGNAETRQGSSPSDQRHWFFLGAGVTLWTTWQISTAVGVYVAARIPESWNLEFALPLTFVALVRPAITDRATAAAAVAAGVIAVLAYGLALRLGLVIAAVAGIAAGILMERRESHALRQ